MNNKTHEFKLKAKKDYQRIDLFLAEHLESYSRSQVEKLIRTGLVSMNQTVVKRKNIRIAAGDIIEVTVLEETTLKPAPSSADLPELHKLYEDERLVIINKPTGISVHPGAGEQKTTILDIFRSLYPQIDNIPDTDRPGIVHRLDKETSGVLILAKDEITMKRMQKKFKRREVRKTYLAFVRGKLRYMNGTIDIPIARNPKHRKKFMTVPYEYYENAREASTDFSLIRAFDEFSFVRLNPHTGRTHQLRVHLAHFGNPILGDLVYGKGAKFKRLALHAYSIEFEHPWTEQTLIARSPLPLVFRQHMQAVLKAAKQY